MKDLKFKFKCWLLHLIIGDEMLVIFNAKITGGVIESKNTEVMGFIDGSDLNHVEVK